ncbi:uncharacterized protein [Argopecten irradians]|uniref:uncharacterized protein n=1 Tax=Argopecten irradians TaxID=31199 RepID=UPI00371A11A8
MERYKKSTEETKVEQEIGIVDTDINMERSETPRDGEKVEQERGTVGTDKGMDRSETPRDGEKEEEERGTVRIDKVMDRSEMPRDGTEVEQERRTVDTDKNMNRSETPRDGAKVDQKRGIGENDKDMDRSETSTEVQSVEEEIDKESKMLLYQEVADVKRERTTSADIPGEMSNSSTKSHGEEAEDKRVTDAFKGKSFNGMRLWYLSTYPCQDIMREILRCKIPLGRSDEDLRTFLKPIFESDANNPVCKYKYLCKSDLFYGDLDLTAMYAIARNCLREEILATQRHWNSKPSDSDFSLQACVDKLRQFRNGISHIKPIIMPNDEDFTKRCKDLKQVFEAVEEDIGLSPRYGKEVVRIMNASKPVDVDHYERELLRLEKQKDDGIYKETFDILARRLEEISKELKKLNNNIGGQKAQTEILLETHEVEERYYVETRMSRKAMDILQQHHHILITGGRGCGKTSLAYHLVFTLMKSGDDCKFFNLHSISEFSEKVDPRGFVVVLVDISKITKKDQAHLKIIIKEFIGLDQPKDLYVIMTTSLEDVSKIANLTREIDMSEPDDETLRLKCDEKRAILQKQLERFHGNAETVLDESTLTNIVQVSELSIPFPLAAYQFAKNEKFREFGAKFFENPVAYYQAEIAKCSERKSNTIVFLALLFEYDPISFAQEETRMKIKDDFSKDDDGRNLCKKKHMKQLHSAAEDLETEELLSSSETKFAFKNATIKHVVLSFAVENYPGLCVRYLNQTTLCDAISASEMSSMLTKPNKDILALRFFEDIVNDRTVALHKSVVWLDQYFIDQIGDTLNKRCMQDIFQGEACINKLLKWAISHRCLLLCVTVEDSLRKFIDERRIEIITKYLLQTCEAIRETRFTPVEPEVKIAQLLQFFVDNGARCSYCTCADRNDTEDHSFPLRWVLDSNDDECLRILLKAGAKDPHSNWGFWDLVAEAAKEEETVLCTSSFVKLQCSVYVSRDQYESDEQLVKFGMHVQNLGDDSNENKRTFICWCIKTIGLNIELVKAMHRQNFSLLDKDEHKNNYIHYALSAGLAYDRLHTTLSCLSEIQTVLSDKNRDNHTPLGMALLQADCDIACIIKISENCTNETITEAVYLCVESELDDDIVSQRVSKLIPFGVNPHQEMHTGKSPMEAVISKGKNRIKTLGILANAPEVLSTAYMLHYAISLDLNQSEKEDVLELLIKEGADVNQQSNDCVTPLMLAIKKTKDNLNLVKLLLSKGADTNIPDKNGLLPLHYCCLSNMESSIAVAMVDLIHHNQEVLETAAEHTPLMLSIIEQNPPDLVLRLADIDFDVRRTDSKGNTVLHLLLRSSLEDHTILEVFQRCLQKFEDMSVMNNDDVPLYGDCLLHACVESSMSDENTSHICQMLIERGASVTEQDSATEKSPLELAVSSGHARVKTICTLLKTSSMNLTDDLLEVIKGENKLTLDLLTSLIHHEIIIESECKVKMTPFYDKDEFSDNIEAKFIEPLTKLGFDLDSRTNAGETLLESACKSSCKPEILIELAKYSRINTKEPYFLWIIDSDRADEDTRECIEALVKKAKHSLDQENDMRRTALIESVRKRKRRAMEYLVASGANPNKRDRYDKTALHYCVETDMRDNEVCDMLSILFEAKPKLNLKDTKGQSILNLAACQRTNSRIRTMTMLLERKCEVETVDESGQTPLHNCLKHLPGLDIMETEERLCRLTILMFFGSNPYCKNNEEQTVIALCMDRKENFEGELEILRQEKTRDLPIVLDKLIDKLLERFLPGDLSEDSNGTSPILPHQMSNVLQKASSYLQNKALVEKEPFVIGFPQDKSKSIVFPFKV